MDHNEELAPSPLVIGAVALPLLAAIGWAISALIG